MFVLLLSHKWQLEVESPWSFLSDTITCLENGSVPDIVRHSVNATAAAGRLPLRPSCLISLSLSLSVASFSSHHSDTL